MLALTIREKNGEERQLIFEKEEVTIGRATGSDIVLPRSNISKRHARLVDKHDKVVIVDLRSTNGTYVNGRRITAPELLTYEDKVYIGDFVIRLSRPAEQHASQRMTAPYTAGPTPEGAAAAPAPGPRASRAPTAAVDGGAAFAESDEGMAPEPRRAPGRAQPAAPPPEEEEDRTRAVAAMMDEEEPAPPPKKVPARKEAPPPAPPPPKKEPAPSPIVTQKTAAGTAKQKAEAPPPPPPAKVAPAPAPSAGRAMRPANDEPPTMSIAVPTVLKRTPPPEPEPAPGDAWTEWNAAIQAVVERIEREHESVPTEDAEVIAADAVAQAIDAGEISQETERDALAADVVSELVGLGPIADTLGDPTVMGIYMNGPKSVFVDRGGGAHEPNGRVFATLASYRRAIANLVGLVDADEIAGVEEIALGDATVRVVGAGLGREPLVVWRRAAQEIPLLPDLVAEGMLDDAQANAITHAIRDGRNVVLCGTPGPARSALAAAMCAEIGERRVVVVGDRTEVALAHGNHARVSSRSLFAGANLLGLEPDLVVFERLDASTVGEWVETCLTAGKPVLALSPEPWVERALKRLGLVLELAQMPAAAGRGAVMIGEAVDLVVALKTQADGTTRVDKLHEVEAGKDGFTLKAPARR